MIVNTLLDKKEDSDKQTKTIRACFLQLLRRSSQGVFSN